MSVNNLGNLHPSAAQKTAVDAAFTTILTNVTPVAPNFSAEERVKYGSIDEKNKLLVNKTNDYHTSQPGLDSPDVDWTEFEADFVTRSWADAKLSQLANLKKMLEDLKIAHDYDNYQASLKDYSYSQYKAGTDTPGFSAKRDDLAQFF